jgi:uncharacterized membrane protein YbaN (DUF454 family)
VLAAENLQSRDNFMTANCLKTKRFTKQVEEWIKSTAMRTKLKAREFIVIAQAVRKNIMEIVN